MSIKLCQATGSTVTPLDDARLYSWIANRAVGIVTGCTVTSAGTNQLSIAAGWGVCQGHMFTISAETIGAVLATSGTLPGRLLIHIDTADTDMPVKFVTQAASTLPALTQEDIDGSGSIYEIPLATYTAGTISISGLTSAAPAAPSLQSEIDSLNASCTQLSQNLAGATGTFTAKNSAVSINTRVDWHKITLIQTTANGAIGRLAILTTDFGWANISGTGYYEPTYAATKNGNVAIIPASVFTGWLSTTGTVRWMAE